jgi:dTDP-4-amino-4,6-dideoxygalactose transaminase
MHAEGGETYTMGANYRLAELQAALGNVALERFPEQVKQRAEMAAYLEESLSEIPGVRLLRRDPRHTTRSFYCYVFALQPEIFGADHRTVCPAMIAEGIPCDSGYRGMHRYELFQPTLSRLPVPNAFPERFKFDEMSFPEVERAADGEAVWLGEHIFRAGRQGIDDLTAALRKIQANAAELAERLAEMVSAQ